MKLNIKFLLAATVALTAVTTYYLTSNIKQQAPTLQKNNESPQKIDYLSINDNEPILDDKFEYYVLPNSEEKNITPPELTKYVREYYLTGYISEFTRESIKPEMCSSLNDEITISSVDLNEDGTKEYIVMPWKVCGRSLRVANGNGDLFIIKNEGGKFETIGIEIIGNGYTISKHKTNGYFDILTNFHSTAATGSETIYKFQTMSNGGSFPPQYESSLTKWYDLTREQK